MEVLVFGTTCKKCLRLEEKIRSIVKENNINAVVKKISDFNLMIKYGIMMVPAIVINDEIKSFGIIPKDEEILMWLKNN